jgi:hypothetical protein
MKKSELLRALQTEIQKHNLSTFTSRDKIVQTGCSTCQKHFGTIEQYTRHLVEDVLPPLLDKLSVKVGIQPAQSVNNGIGGENPAQD